MGGDEKVISEKVNGVIGGRGRGVEDKDEKMGRGQMGAGRKFFFNDTATTETYTE